MLFKIKTFTRRFFNRLFKGHRPASYPYLSGDGFRSIAHFIYDQFVDFDPQVVTYGDMIFVRNNHLSTFFTDIHPNIKEPYVLITHNADATVTDQYKDYIDEKILHWYAENLTFKHIKATVLPIGLQNFIDCPSENFINYAHENTKKQSVKKDRILYGFSLQGYSQNERNEAYQVFKKSNLADEVSLPRIEYYETLKDYKFIASPSGGGLDCHRTWEALYLKVIPIMIRNVFSEQLIEQGFPLLLVDKWSDILDFSTKDLATYYEKNENSFTNPRLYLQYWYDAFTSHKNLRN